VYIDLWPTDSEGSFITTTARAITGTFQTTIEKTLELSKELFSRLKPTVTVDRGGHPSFTFEVARSNRLNPELEEVLGVPERIGGKGKTVVVVFDEFQQILMYGRDDIERKLRSIIQHQKNVAYIFMGSRKHVIREIFLKGSKPLYRSAAQFPLGPIQEKDWIPFIIHRFHSTKRKITAANIHIIVGLTQGHPFYTQHLCYALWERCEPGHPVSDRLIQDALTTVLEKEAPAFSAIWESLTANQQRFLKALAVEHAGAKLYSAEFLQKHELGLASSAQRVLRSLVDKDIVDRQNGTYFITDRFLRLWVQRLTHHG
jgi:hypothetical protein